MNLRKITALFLVFCFLSQAAVASHLTTEQELRAELASLATDRASKIQSIERLLRHEVVRDQIGKLADLKRVEEALPTLDDETLHRLAAQSEKLNDELKGGQICAATIALIVLVAAVIVVAIVAWA
jgi:hypothetical protein